MQAIGAALLQANSVAIVVSAVGERRRGHAIGLQAAAQAVGLSAGPALGGLLIYTLGWRWVFWVNVPFGLLGAAIGWAVLPQTAASRRPLRLVGRAILCAGSDRPGHVRQSGPGMGPDLAGFYWLRRPAGRDAACALRADTRRRQEAPLLDLRLFRRYAFWAGNLSGLLSYAMLFGLSSSCHSCSSVATRRIYRSGLRLATIPVALGLLSPVSGALYDRLRARI